MEQTNKTLVPTLEDTRGPGAASQISSELHVCDPASPFDEQLPPPSSDGNTLSSAVPSPVAEVDPSVLSCEIRVGTYLVNPTKESLMKSI